MRNLLDLPNEILELIVQEVLCDSKYFLSYQWAPEAALHMLMASPGYVYPSTRPPLEELPFVEYNRLVRNLRLVNRRFKDVVAACGTGFLTLVVPELSLVAAGNPLIDFFASPMVRDAYAISIRFGPTTSGLVLHSFAETAAIVEAVLGCIRYLGSEVFATHVAGCGAFSKLKTVTLQGFAAGLLAPFLVRLTPQLDRIFLDTSPGFDEPRGYRGRLASDLLTEADYLGMVASAPTLRVDCVTVLNRGDGWLHWLLSSWHAQVVELELVRMDQKPWFDRELYHAALSFAQWEGFQLFKIVRHARHDTQLLQALANYWAGLGRPIEVFTEEAPGIW